MEKTGIYRNIYYTLCIAAAMCFIGHGSFGIITKAVWCNYFAVVGIGHDLAYRIMPVIGCFDILLGLLMLAYPIKAIPAWLVVWGIFTALLRPLSGEPFAEFIERAGNFGAPLALILLTGMPAAAKGWFTRMQPNLQPDAAVQKQLQICLKAVVFFLLLGHGWLNMIEKKTLLAGYAAIGFAHPAQVAQIAGITEILFAVLVLVKPARPLLLAFFIWKAGTELFFYPHYLLFEWIERGGSYGAILGLWFLVQRPTGEIRKPGNALWQAVPN